MFDDNTSPTEAFLWCNGLRRSEFKDVQFNHVWAESRSVVAYTSLANVFVTPAFLAKLTDTDEEIGALMKYRVFDLYVPEGKDAPEKPEIYSDLNWRAPVRAVADLEQTLRSAMKSKPKNRTVRSARELGWIFSDYKPDGEL